MSEQKLKYDQKDFEIIVEKIIKINDKIGQYELGVQNNEFSYLIWLTNGKIIIPDEVMQDRGSITDDDSRLRMIAESFMPLDENSEKNEVIVYKSLQTNNIKKNKHFNKKYYFVPLMLLIACIALYFLFIYKNHYEKGVSLLKENQYESALLEFRKIDSLDKNYKISLSKLNYTMGRIELNKREYLNALKYFELTNENDDLILEINKLKSDLKNNPVVIYDFGMRYIRIKNYDSALIKFKEIGIGDTLYSKACFKINYIMAFKKIEEQKYDLADLYLKDYDINDELIVDVTILQEKINNHRDFEENNKYAKFLLDIYDKIASFYSKYYYTPSHPPLQETYDTQHELLSIIDKLTSYKYEATQKDNLLLNYYDALYNTMNLILERIYSYENYLKGIMTPDNFTYIRDNLVVKLDLGFTDCGRYRRDVNEKYH